MLTMPDMEVPSTRQTLLEHLYVVITSLAPAQQTARITGMFTECSQQQLLHLLTNRDVLHKQVQQAVSALNSRETEEEKCSPVLLETESKADSPDHLELGNRLFAAVAEVETGLSAQVTGMLLELAPTTIESLLANPTDLGAAVDKARKEYLKINPCPVSPPAVNRCQSDADNDNDPACDIDSRDQDIVGQELYEHIVKSFPRNAAKLTGMLMELQIDKLRHLLGQTEELESKIAAARLTLERSGQWIEEC